VHHEERCSVVVRVGEKDPDGLGEKFGIHVIWQWFVRERVTHWPRRGGCIRKHAIDCPRSEENSTGVVGE
jgi:hypothetical protein